MPPTSGAPTAATPSSRRHAGGGGAFAFGGRPLARDPRRHRLPGVPRIAAARRCSASACCSCRPTAIPARSTPSRGRPRRRPRRPGRSRAAGRAAGRRCSRHRRGSTRRPRPSGPRSATCTATAVTATTPTGPLQNARALSAPRVGGGGRAGGGERRSGGRSWTRRRDRRPDAVLRIEPGTPGAERRSCSGWARATAALQMPPLGTELVDERRARPGPPMDRRDG